jgi:hypothetical protein
LPKAASHSGRKSRAPRTKPQTQIKLNECIGLLATVEICDGKSGAACLQTLSWRKPWIRVPPLCHNLIDSKNELAILPSVGHPGFWRSPILRLKGRAQTIGDVKGPTLLPKLHEIETRVLGHEVISDGDHVEFF